jgi:PAS domain S-box-containing protein
MSNIAHDLFLLMAHLTQVKNQDKALEIFIQAINDAFPSLSFFFMENNSSASACHEIATSTFHFGYLGVEGSPSEEENMLVQNAVQTLAVFLERSKQDNILREKNLDLEKLIRERTRSLKKSENAFRTITENSPDITARYNKDLVCQYVSRNIQEIIHVPVEEIIHKKLSGTALPRRTSIKFEEAIRQVIKTQQAHQEFFDFSTGHSMLVFDSRFIPEANDNGEVETVLVVSRDVTRQKLNEKELMEAKQKAEEADRLKSAFLANMSHEIRTPMNGIVGFAQLLMNKNLGNEKKHKFIDIINENSKQLLAIINDIMDISKIEAEQVKIQKSRFALAEFLQKTHDTFLPVARKKQVKLILDKSNGHDNLMITTDNARLKQIFQNLLSNAIKFTAEGYVQFGYKLDGNFMQFYVKDTGIGIASEYHEIIFDRFRQADSGLNKHHGGNGLGLAISKSLTGLLGGKIWLESTVGKGTTFYFTIPLDMNG